MDIRRKVLVTAVTTGLLVGAVPAARAVEPGSGPAAGPPAGAAAGAAVARAVTLLSGDRVRVLSGDASRFTVERAAGREHARFVTERVHGDLLVLPLEALTLIADGTVDRRLFDVSLLLRSGYDDARRANLPVIVSYGRAAGTARAAAPTTLPGVTVARDLPAVGGVAGIVPKDHATGTWQALTAAAPAATTTTPGPSTRATTPSGVTRIWLDGLRRPALDRSVPQIGGPAAWQAGYTGKGVRVAVLDTGVDATHPDLAGAVALAQNFTDDPDTRDTVGHGTHVASTIAGSGAASGGKYRGVAPDASLLIGKVCQENGCPDSAILAGMQWAAEQHATVANLSLGGPDDADLDPLEEAVNTLTAQSGTLYVIAAGNDGPAAHTVSSPGSADAALTVGAVDRSDAIAPFSSRGPRTGDDAVKPDLTAPGVGIVAARAAGTSEGSPVGDTYTALSGTSMATPHVTGSVALLAQEHPGWTAAQYKDTLMAAARPAPDQRVTDQGAGRVDVARAVTQNVSASPPSVSFGIEAWPHDDDQPVTRTVTYRNDGTADVVLDLALTPDRAATGAVVTPDTTHLTVPAGGTADVHLTATIRPGDPDGVYSGELSATAGASRVVTPLSITKEVESYDITLTFTDRTGAAPGFAAALVSDLASGDQRELVARDGTLTARLPKGRYDVLGLVASATGDDLTVLAQPVLTVSATAAVAFDARTAAPVTLTVPDPSATPVALGASYTDRTPTQLVEVGIGGAGALFVGRQGPAAPADQKVTGGVFGEWDRPVTAGGTAEQYLTVKTFPGGLPHGYERHYHASELATVHHDLAGAGGTTGLLVTTLAGDVLAGSGGVQLPLPAVATVHLSTDDRPSWITDVLLGTTAAPDAVTGLLEGVREYRLGAPVRELWNRAPFGPVLPAPVGPSDYVTRAGDVLYAFPPLVGDAAGHSGWALDGTATTLALYREGTLVARADSVAARFDVPPEPATYRLDATGVRADAKGPSSTVAASWTFRSGHTDPAPPTPLPLLAVRYGTAVPTRDAADGPDGPRTDDVRVDGLRPARFLRIPVTVQAQQGSTARRPVLTGVEVSTDDGGTWTPVTLHRDGDGWTVTTARPTTGWVSLRATARDQGGDLMTQTVLHGYGPAA